MINLIINVIIYIQFNYIYLYIPLHTLIIEMRRNDGQVYRLLLYRINKEINKKIEK